MAVDAKPAFAGSRKSNCLESASADFASTDMGFNPWTPVNGIMPVNKRLAPYGAGLLLDMAYPYVVTSPLGDSVTCDSRPPASYCAAQLRIAFFTVKAGTNYQPRNAAKKDGQNLLHKLVQSENGRQCRRNREHEYDHHKHRES